MPSYKIHSIKNNKKLSFIIEGDDVEKVKQSLSADGFIVLTVDEIAERKSHLPRFVFEALKENKSRIEGQVDALDIFSAYEILRNDYQYTILKLYPIDVIDTKEQEEILKNIHLLYPENEKKAVEVVKTKTFTEVDILKKYLDILETLVEKNNIPNKEMLLYDIKRVQMINSISSSEEIIKKTIKIIYNKSSVEIKKDIYKTISPIVKHVHMFIFPPWIFRTIIILKDFLSLMKILFGIPTKKQEHKKQAKKTAILFHKFLKRNDTPEKKMFANKNVYILMKKKYRGSWLDIFKTEGTYFYFYSLFRQYNFIFWLKKIQEYIGMVTLHSLFLFIIGVILTGVTFGVDFLFFNEFLPIIITAVCISLVFFFKEI